MNTLYVAVFLAWRCIYWTDLEFVTFIFKFTAFDRFPNLEGFTEVLYSFQWNNKLVHLSQGLRILSR